VKNLKLFLILFSFLECYDVLADGCTTINFTASATPNSFCSYDFVAIAVQNTDCDYSQPYDYYWDFDDGSPLVYGTLNPSHQYSQSGTYQVSLTFVGICHGTLTTCTQVENIVINLPPPPAITTTTSQYIVDNTIYNVSCNGASDGFITLSSVGSYSFEWQTTPTQIGNTISNISAGVYNVVGILSGCPTQPLTITITEPPIIVSSPLFSNPSCANYEDGFIEPNISGGLPPFQFSWSNGATTENIYNLNNLPYQLQVVDESGCTFIFNFDLKDPLPLNPVITNLSNYNGFNVSCFNSQDAFVDITTTGSHPPYSFQWSNGDLTEDLTNVQSGIYFLNITDKNLCDTTISVNLSQPNIFSSTINSTTNFNGFDISCNGFSDGSIDFEVTGSVPPYSYFWNSGQITQDISSVNAGAYIVNVLDNNGCSHSNTITLTEPTSLVGTIQSSNNYNSYDISCNGYLDGGINLTINGSVPPYDYTWNNGATNQNLTNIGAGFYSVQVIDDNNCIINQDITLTEPINFNSTYTVSDYNGFNISCFNNNDGLIDFTLGGGVPPYSFDWSGPNNFQSNNEDNNNLYAGVYTLQVTDINSCTYYETVILNEPTDFSSTINSTTNFNGFDISCNGFSDGSIDFEVTGSVPPYSYFWNSGQITQDISSVNAGAYIVNVLDNNGCSHSNTITLTEPTSLVGTIQSSNNYNSYDISCNGYLDGGINLTINGSVPPYDYTWNNGATNQNLTNIGAGFYSVQVIDDNNCIINQDITLTEPINFNSTYTVSDYNGFNISCFNNNDGLIDFTLGGGVPPYSFDWSGPNNFQSNNEDNNNLYAGVYTLQVTDINSCTYYETVILNEPTEITYKLYTENDTCNKNIGLALVNVTGGAPTYKYFWDGILSSKNLNSNLNQGPHSLVISDQNNCELLAKFNIDNLPSPIADFTVFPNEYRLIEQLGSGIYFYDNSYDSWSSITSWLWDTGDLQKFTSKNIFHKYDEIGTYNVTLIVENEYGCFDTISKPIFIKEYTIYIPNAFTPKGLNKVFTPKGIGIKEYKLQIFSRWGELLFTSFDINDGWDGTFRNNNVQIGVYKYKLNIIDVFDESHQYFGEIHLLE